MSDSIMYTGDSLKITHILYLLNRLVCLSQLFQMIVLRILLELYRDVFEAVVYLEFGLKHDGFQISGGLISTIILKGVVLLFISLLDGVCVVPISDILLIRLIAFVVVVSHV